MKSMFAIGLTFTILLGLFNSIFEGRVVAKLPFVPLALLQGISHRGLLGDDYTDCSFIFLYIVATVPIRQTLYSYMQNLQKLLGFAPSRAAAKIGGGLFEPPTNWASNK